MDGNFRYIENLGEKNTRRPPESDKVVFTLGGLATMALSYDDRCMLGDLGIERAEDGSFSCSRKTFSIVLDDLEQRADTSPYGFCEPPNIRAACRRALKRLRKLS